ncbi:hypothetical protein, partial [Acinetobacter baumannii]|uniref:hypothetical protein n=1 Tax=Acinetobacter baumannii TaxID=470 RepID=UPI00339784F5
RRDTEKTGTTSRHAGQQIPITVREQELKGVGKHVYLESIVTATGFCDVDAKSCVGEAEHLFNTIIPI